MTKESSNSTDSTTVKKNISKKTENKHKKEDTTPTSTPDNASPDQKDPESNQPDSPEIKKKTYVRGESQKPVTKEYRDNWNSIFKKG